MEKKKIIFPDGSYLGKICQNGHDFMQMGYSWRYADRHCKTCRILERQKKKAKRDDNK